MPVCLSLCLGATAALAADFPQATVFNWPAPHNRPLGAWTSTPGRKSPVPGSAQLHPVGDEILIAAAIP